MRAATGDSRWEEVADMAALEELLQAMVYLVRSVEEPPAPVVKRKWPTFRCAAKAASLNSRAPPFRRSRTARSLKHVLHLAHLSSTVQLRPNRTSARFFLYPTTLQNPHKSRKNYWRGQRKTGMTGDIRFGRNCTVSSRFCSCRTRPPSSLISDLHSHQSYRHPRPAIVVRLSNYSSNHSPSPSDA
ncbi:hypothetical protein PsYK624_131270 [Phanerochaete sordida]|uniref:Uncharacterized protein n=1 Tax=Phanerochaete sordida TaxID=48140 RepID=A0A9P3GP39_9APHY|nr:hypothetical protein PsYK624_131270 [Phanerochaete sordida]